jgi:glycosyltransferase involved in cell wall biosynthesis
MNITVVAQQMRQPVPGGIGTYIRGLVQGLAEGSHPDLEIAFLASRASERPDPLAAWGRVIDSPWGHRGLAFLWEHELVRAPLGADVVHATSLAFPSLRKNSGAKSSMFLHDVAWRTHPEFYPERGRAFHERALGRALASEAALLVPSTSTADELIKSGVSSARLSIVGEGSDHLPLLPRVSDGEFLLAVSTQEPRKNLSRLIEAYARIRTRLPEPWPLYIVGPKGWSGRTGEKPVVGDGQEGVELLGPVSDDRLAELLATARTFAYVPLVEGYGLPPVEAMRAGVPVVASAVPSVDSERAFIVNPLDVDDIARGLLRVSTDDDLRTALVQRGRSFAIAQTWKIAADAHADAWRTLIKTGRTT